MLLILLTLKCSHRLYITDFVKLNEDDLRIVMASVMCDVTVKLKSNTSVITDVFDVLNTNYEFTAGFKLRLSYLKLL